MKLVIQIKSSLLFNIFYCLFCLYTNSFWLNIFKTKKVKNVKLSDFVIYVKAIIYLLLYSLYVCAFKSGSPHFFILKQK